MKQFILTVLVLCLVFILLKKKQKENFYLAGCRVQNLVKPTEEDFYKCFLDDIENYSGILSSKNIFSRVELVKKISERIKNYFINLNIHGLEKDYRAIIVIIPASFRGFDSIKVLSTGNIRMKKFMSGEQGNNGIYRLQEEYNHGGTKDDRINKLEVVSLTGVNGVNQIHGIYVSMGFRFGVSNRKNNKNAQQCRGTEYRPSRHGQCIPGRFDDYLDLERASRDPNLAGGQKYHEQEPSKWRYRVRPSHHSSKGCGHRHEQRDIQRQKGLDSCMSSCYMRSRAGCHHAYGNSPIKEVYIVPDPDFFNTFYVNSKKKEFLETNYSSLNRF